MIFAANTFKKMISKSQKQLREGTTYKRSLFIPLKQKCICVCYTHTHTYTHTIKENASISLLGKKCETKEPETLNNIWKKKQTGSEGYKNQRKKNTTQGKAMYRLKPHFPPLMPLGHLNLEGLTQFIE